MDKDAVKRRGNVLWYGILAGAAIAFGGILFLLAKFLIPEDSIVPSSLVGALLFPVGLLLVCYFKLNLYTGKIGMAFRNPKLDKKGLNTFEWLFWILLGNAIGAFAIGAAIYAFTLIDPSSAFSKTVYAVASSRSTEFDFNGLFGMFYKSVLCGALVYIAIYLFNKLPNQFGKVVGVVTPIAFFVYAGFQHCIANMFYIASGAQWNANAFVGLLLCIVGNSLGALLLDLFVKYE
ncbi:MAG: formate/nitrite transporter family protein [Bacilli bacterium]|nr:formate/nitrite transporter family protein [Bacilli bacterium]